MSRKAFLFLFIAAVAAFAAVGTLNVTIKEYEVPTPKSRPHDPARAPDGALWYTGQGANKLGRLDPSTGAFKEYPLKTPGSGPHGLVADSRGNIWFTAISGRLCRTPRSLNRRRQGIPSRPTKPKSIHTRRSSITTAPSGSPTKKPTTSAASILPAAR